MAATKLSRREIDELEYLQSFEEEPYRSETLENSVRRRSTWLWAIYLFLALGYGWTGYMLLTQPEFAVSDIQVIDHNLASKEEIIRATGIMGTNLFLVDGLKVEELLTKLPPVHTARVTLSFPNHARIEIEERRPALEWQTKGGTFLVDREGILLSTAPLSSSLPKVQGLDGPPLTVGQRLPVEIVETALALYGFLPYLNPPDKSVLEYSQTRGFTFKDERGRPVTFGVGGNIEEKVATLKSISTLAENLGLGIETIDLRFDSKPYLKELRPVSTVEVRR